MPIHIRALRIRDYAALVELFRVCGLNPRVRGRDSREAIARQLRSFPDVYLGAFDGERLVGAVLGTHDVRKGWINRLAIYPEYRRRGIAARLVRRCERSLRARGIEMFAALIEPGNEVSERVFRALGYELIRLTYARKKRRPEV